jgi:hypothetical protein
MRPPLIPPHAAAPPSGNEWRREAEPARAYAAAQGLSGSGMRKSGGGSKSRATPREASVPRGSPLREA